MFLLATFSSHNGTLTASVQSTVTDVNAILCSNWWTRLPGTSKWKYIACSKHNITTIKRSSSFLSIQKRRTVLELSII